MPVFNDRGFLVGALKSLLDQTHKNFELIISDDASTDGSAEVCKRFAALDHRIRYIRQPTNLGISRNMQFLLGEAKGEFFMWAGDDDLWHPMFVAILIEELRNRPEAISAYSSVSFIGEKGEEAAGSHPRATNFAAPTAYLRVKKLIATFDDSFGYGLFRRSEILGVRFPVWRGVNRINSYNNIYPTLCYYLSRGNFVLAEGAPLHFKRIKNPENVHHKVPFSDSFVRGYVAFLSWKRDLIVASLAEIVSADEHWTAVRVAPAMIVRWGIWPSMLRFAALCLKLVRGKISFY